MDVAGSECACMESPHFSPQRKPSESPTTTTGEAQLTDKTDKPQQQWRPATPVLPPSNSPSIAFVIGSRQPPYAVGWLQSVELGLASQLKVLSALLFVIGGSATLIVTFLRQRNRQLSHRRFKLGTLCCLERPFFDFCRDRAAL